MNAYNTPYMPPAIARMRAKFLDCKVIANNLSHADALKGSWPIGSVYVACLETMFEAPPFKPSEARPQESNMAYERFKAAQRKVGNTAEIDTEKADYFRAILAKPVRPGASEEELVEAERITRKVQ